MLKRYRLWAVIALMYSFVGSTIVTAENTIPKTTLSSSDIDLQYVCRAEVDWAGWELVRQYKRYTLYILSDVGTNYDLEAIRRLRVTVSYSPCLFEFNGSRRSGLGTLTEGPKAQEVDFPGIGSFPYYTLLSDQEKIIEKLYNDCRKHLPGSRFIYVNKYPWRFSAGGAKSCYEQVRALFEEQFASVYLGGDHTRVLSFMLGMPFLGGEQVK